MHQYMIECENRNKSWKSKVTCVKNSKIPFFTLKNGDLYVEMVTFGCDESVSVWKNS